MTQITVARAVAALDNPFGRFKPEIEQRERKLEVVETKTLQQLKAAWRKFKYRFEDKDGGNGCTRGVYFDQYGNALSLVTGIEYSAADVEKFSLMLKAFENERDPGFKSHNPTGFSQVYFPVKAGLFLSALINNGKDRDYVVHTTHLEKEISVFGIYNTKNVLVDGPVGFWAGLRHQPGGILRINGDAGSWPGYEMKGGEIHIDGECHDFVQAEVTGGRIYHKGELLFNFNR